MADSMEVLRVTLYRRFGEDLGLAVVGGVDNGVSGLIVSRVVEDSEAGQDDRLMVGDKIIRAGKHDLAASTLEEAMAVIRSLPNLVSFIIERPTMKISSMEPLDTEMSKDLGSQVQVFRYDDESNDFQLNLEALENILLSADCRNRLVSVISVAGAGRRFKSFMLNCFLTYLSSDCSSSWLENIAGLLKGSEWKSGSSRDIAGISMWSKPLIKKMADGREVAVLLLDTQGFYNGKHTKTDTAVTFALSSLLSSVQVYNLSVGISDDDLENVALLSAHSLRALKTTNDITFQKLVFLIRNWQHSEQQSYGIEGGNAILDDLLNLREKQASELSHYHHFLGTMLHDVDCSLLPNPGNLEVTGRTLLEYFKTYFIALTGHEQAGIETQRQTDEILDAETSVKKPIQILQDELNNLKLQLEESESKFASLRSERMEDKKAIEELQATLQNLEKKAKKRRKFKNLFSSKRSGKV
ncbi:Atlastin-2 [Halotydeus destructor]|nr:Atlastin-2 [Halotydeus destructor]